MPVAPQGFEAWIEVEGRRLEEFKAELNGDNMACWVPCDTGKEFAVGCTIPAERLRSNSHIVHLTLDGEPAYIDHCVVLGSKSAAQAQTRHFSYGFTDDYSTTRTFQFGSLELTDNDLYLQKTAKRFGEISISIWTSEGFTRHDSSTLSKPTVDQDYRIHERAKKGLAHCVKFGEAKPSAVPSSFLKPVGYKLLFTFVFNYRQLDILAADGIAPRKKSVQVQGGVVASSSISPPGTVNQGARKRALDEVKEEEKATRDRDLLEPTDEEIQRIEDQLADLKARKAQAAANNGQPPAKRVKREHKSTFIPGEIIDLTNVPSRSSFKREPKPTLVPGEVIDLT